uniref:NADH-ubiquinone oxidoreductase chain 4L n=1 Tax=Pandarus rhincodonicus TaxID=1473543 RepID=A0A024J5G5_PANRH|nr:NADH dehydrogenase subunit 4L [Pandarus rhincodonicus]
MLSSLILLSSTLSLSIPPLILMILPPILALMTLLKNKGQLLMVLLALEAMTATMIFPLIYYILVSHSNASVIFLFIVVTVCEACLGLAILISLSRNSYGSLGNSSFFLN